MIVGKVLKAKLIKPGWNPTPSTYDVNKKLAPESEKLIKVVIALSRKLKIGVPKGVLRIKTAKINCNPNPRATVFILIFFLFSDNRNAMNSNVKIPIRPLKFPIIVTDDYVQHEDLLY